MGGGHLGGGPEFLRVVKGGTSFVFSGSKGGGPEFLWGHRGGTRILSQILTIYVIGCSFKGGPEFFSTCQGS